MQFVSEFFVSPCFFCMYISLSHSIKLIRIGSYNSYTKYQIVVLISDNYCTSVFKSQTDFVTFLLDRRCIFFSRMNSVECFYVELYLVINSLQVKLKFILDYVKAPTVLWSIQFLSSDQTLFINEHSLSTGAGVPGKEETNLVTSMRLRRRMLCSFKSVNTLTYFSSSLFSPIC